MPSTLDDYEVLGTIGSGSYGTCKKIRRKRDGKILVWKELDYGTMSEAEKQMLVSEVNLLRELKHNHIVRYYDRIIDRSNTTLYIIMEYCEGGDLASHISKCKREGRHTDEEFVWRVCTQTTLALKECHNRQRNGKAVLHRDLKPANVFLDGSNNVKLGDFGLARVLSHETSFARTFVGTPYYMSPEQMNYMSYNEKSDVWSLGCLLYELCSLRPPFTASNQSELASKICVGRFNRLPLRYSDELNAIISFMLTVEEFRRPTIDDLLKHPIMQQRLSKSSSSGRKSSTGSSVQDEGYESIKRREEALKVKEQQLALKEKELESRERTVVLREKLAEERLARAEKLMKEAAEKRLKIGDINTMDNLTDSKPLSSCLSKGTKLIDSPKKKVSFHVRGKENRRPSYSKDVSDDLINSYEEKTESPRLEERLGRLVIEPEKEKSKFSPLDKPTADIVDIKSADTKEAYKVETTKNDLTKDLYKYDRKTTTSNMNEFHSIERKLELEHMKRMLDLKQRLYKMRERSDEFNKETYDTKYRYRHVQGIR